MASPHLLISIWTAGPAGPPPPASLAGSRRIDFGFMPSQDPEILRLTEASLVALCTAPLQVNVPVDLCYYILDLNRTHMK